MDEAGSRGVEGDLNIEFVIAKDGALQSVQVRRSSKVTILDAAALNAVKLAQSFPPIPDELAKRALVINGHFIYRIRESDIRQLRHARRHLPPQIHRAIHRAHPMS